MRSDEEQLLCILRESGEVLKYFPVSLERFIADEFLQAWLPQRLRNIGEAAWRLSTELRSLHDEVSWQRIIDMMGYYYMDPVTVWQACAVEVPALAPQIETILRELRESSPERDERQ